MKANMVTPQRVMQRMKQLDIQADNKIEEEYINVSMPYLQHIVYFCDTLSNQFNTNEVPVWLDESKILKSAKIGTISMRDGIRYIRDSGIKGELYGQQLLTSADIISNVYIGIDTNEPLYAFNHLPAPPQWGKSGVLCSMSMIGPILKLAFDRTYHIYTILPPMLGLAATVRESHTNFLHLYGDIDLVVAGHGSMSLFDMMSVNDFRGTHLNYDPANTDNKMLAFDPETSGRVMQIANGVPIHRGMKSVADMEAAVNEMKTPHSMYLFDEVHYAPNNESVMGKMLKIIKSQKTNRLVSPILTASATGYEFNGKSQVNMVMPHMDASYTGTYFLGGVKFDPSLDLTTPSIFSTEEYGEKINVPDLKKFRGTALSGGNALKQVKAEYNFSGDVNTYRNMCARAIVDTTVYSINDDTVTRGSLIRFPKNGVADNMINRMQKYINAYDSDKPIYILKYYGTNSKFTVENMLAPVGDAYYIIVVTGTARMGCDFPPSCGIAIDTMAKSPSTQSAAEQGSYGRMCGYNKTHTIVVYQENVAIKMRRFVDTLGSTFAADPTSGHTERAGKAIGQYSHLRLVKDNAWEKSSASIRKMFTKLQNRTNAAIAADDLRFTNKKAGKGMKNYTGETSVWEEELNPRVCSFIERHGKNLDVRGNQFKIVCGLDGDTKIGFRTITKVYNDAGGKHASGGRPSLHMKMGTSEVKELHLLVQVVGKRGSSRPGEDHAWYEDLK